jgi:NAD(P)-dependent dehydrogenase (short-subunit alcohol dehydrogenase family)
MANTLVAAWLFAGRVGVPEDVAELCLFLADPSKAAFITGAV